jgi:hypothetical protein
MSARPPIQPVGRDEQPFEVGAPSLAGTFALGSAGGSAAACFDRFGIVMLAAVVALSRLPGP